MTTELCWVASFSASCWHAVAQIAAGRTLVDAELAEALVDPLAVMHKELAGRNVPLAKVLQHLAGLSAGIDANRQLAETALLKALGRIGASPPTVDVLARHIAALEAAVDRVRPELADELAHRARPLQELWEARGPGFLLAMRQLTEPDVVVERADVVLVHPVLGGGGSAYLPYNVATIEAVLANPHEQLPETVRLGWLLSQLNGDLPRFSEEIPADRRPLVVAAAMLPATLAAGQQVEWCANNPQLVETAVTAWRLAHQLPSDGASRIMNWWETYTAGRPAWNVALNALNRMLVS